MVGDSNFRIILGRRGYGFIAAILVVLFIIFFFILTPGNFSSFSNTLRYFISGLATLLAVVVSFNTLALRNQLNNMPTSMEALDGQLDKISKLLQPVIKQREKNEEQQSSSSSYKKSATLYYTDAMTSMLQESRRYAESIVKKNYDNSRKQELSIEMLISTIPIITFTAIISSISNYEQYNPLLLRLLFAASSSIVVMPFLQLFVRTMPVLSVIHSSSSIPFIRKGQG